MLSRILTLLAVTSLTATVGAQSDVTPALYVTAADIASALQASANARPNMAVGTITTTDDYRINLIRRTAPAGAITHAVGTELHYITEGAGILVTGGTIVAGSDGGNSTIANGVSRRVTVGDAILIPEGTPHWYSAIEGAISYLEVRF